jgi:hypothetical protein
LDNSNEQGGAMHINVGDSNITYCTFCNCTTQNEGGGAISFAGKTLRIENCLFLACVTFTRKINSSTILLYSGGGLRIYMRGGYCKNCSFLNCESNNIGGALGHVNGITAETDILEVVDCIFGYNSAANNGGAVDTRNISLNCINCSFFDNSVNSFGGAVSVQLKKTAFFDNCAFSRNFIKGCTSTGGGAIYINPVTSSVEFTITNSIFYENDFWDKICNVSMFIFHIYVLKKNTFFFIYLLDISDIRVSSICSVTVESCYSKNYNSSRRVL